MVGRLADDVVGRLLGEFVVGRLAVEFSWFQKDCSMPGKN